MDQLTIRLSKTPKHNEACDFCTKPIDQTRRSNRAIRFCDKKCKTDYYNNLQTRDFRRGNHMLKRYGISLEEYNSRLAQQGGKCLLCGTLEADARYGVLDVDHDHDSGTVRGLLCHQCNWALGILGDDPAKLRRAADYLEEKL